MLRFLSLLAAKAALALVTMDPYIMSLTQSGPGDPTGGGGGDSAGPRTPTTPRPLPPPLRGLRPTVSCQRYEPKEPTGAKGAPAPKAPNGVM